MKKKLNNYYFFPARKRIDKLLLTMKLSCLITFFFAIQVSANVYSQNNLLDLELRNKTIREVLKTIESQSEFRFFYNDDFTTLNKLVNIDVQQKKVDDILQELFANASVTYKIMSDNVVVLLPSSELQQKKVMGSITDASNGEPLIGVNIVIEGTTAGVVSDIDGRYSIDVPSSESILLFSFVGYAPMRMPVQGQSTINVQLTADIKSLEEVVVVGYGTMKKLDVSGSIVSAKSEVIREVPSTNATAALQGRLPGIEMSQVSTRPGATMQIRIRGERSLYATNDPLIVVDGIPFSGSINDIATTDIKSIDILKDASSTAIYGSRGANGVILITTFRGVNNSEPTITYNGYYGIKTVAKKYEVYNGEEFQRFRNETLATPYKDQFTNLEKEAIASGKFTDWQDLMYSNAMVTSHDFAVSSGSKKGAFSLGGGYYDETAVLPGQEYSRFSLRATIDQEIGKFIKVGLSTQNTYGVTDGESASLMNNILTLSPLMPAYNEDGSVRKIPTEGWVDTYYNPLLLKDESLWRETRKRFSTSNSLYGEIKFTDFLRYRANIGLGYYKETYGRFYGSDTPYQSGSENTATVQNRNNTVWTIENLLYFDKVLAEKHRVNVTAMYSAEKLVYDQSQMSGTNLPANYLQYFNLGLADGSKTIDAANQDYYERGLLSYMGRVQYAYDDRYMLTATFRSDGSSVLASGEQWHSYPAISAGWNIHNESFLKSVNAISQLKLRLGYGQTSNQAINAYGTIGSLSQVPYNFGTTNSYGYLVSELPNYNLGWEFTKNYNIGLDFGFLDNRITGYVDYYYQKTEDVLVKVQLPPTSGVSGTMWQNVGSTENKGIEFSISAQIIKPSNEGGFRWDVDFNLYANRNKLVSLNSGVTKDVGNGFFTGHPINVIYDYEKLGIIQENESPYLGYRAGQIKVADLGGSNGIADGQISGDYDRKILGSFEPDFAGGFTTRFLLKNFDLSAVSFFKSGGMLISTIHMPHSYLSTNNARRNSIKVDYWTPSHPTGTYPQPGNQTSADLNDFGSTLGYFDASFLKVRTITLGYAFSPRLLSHIGCKNARIYFTCQNPFTLFSPYMDAGGLDPEATGTGPQGANASLTGGITSRALTIGANTPPTRNYLVGVSLKF